MVKLNSQYVNVQPKQNVNREVKISRENSQESQRTKQFVESVSEWPNEDDSSLLDSLLTPVSMDSQTHTQPHNQTLKSEDIQGHERKDTRNNSTSSQQNPSHISKSVQSMETVKAKFPGPAGFLNLPLVSVTY